ncbi:heme-copper oxidase subunit III [Aurantibacter sp.]|uniref:cytochrome c oxidase subunit 3 n=1 Tax=Aurantibacter sp. TaxID=2807103 RepID=UPI0035C793D9
MDLTEGTLQEKTNRSKKMMMYFGIASLIMSFGGLTSAFIVSSSRPDWLVDFKMPTAFIISVFVILASSITLFVARQGLKQGNKNLTTTMLLLTFALGIYFVINQFNGFSEIIEMGYNFTGPTSNVTMSYIYLIAMVHIAHVVAGLICLLVVIYNHFKQKYTADEMTGFEVAAIFWHFVDILWVYLFLFLYFMA